MRQPANTESTKNETQLCISSATDCELLKGGTQTRLILVPMKTASCLTLANP